MLALPTDRPVICFVNLLGLCKPSRADYVLDRLPETALIPAYSYSYTRSEPYGLAAPVRSGALGAAALARGWYRSNDPIFSLATRMTLPKRYMCIQNVHCFGEQSLWGWLAAQQAMIALLGVDLNACTAVHHFEKLWAVPYRYDKTFSGVTNGHPSEAVYFCRIPEMRLVTELSNLEAAMQLEYRGEWPCTVFSMDQFQQAIYSTLAKDVYGLTTRL